MEQNINIIYEEKDDKGFMGISHLCADIEYERFCLVNRSFPVYCSDPRCFV